MTSTLSHRRQSLAARRGSQALQIDLSSLRLDSGTEGAEGHALSQSAPCSKTSTTHAIETAGADGSPPLQHHRKGKEPRPAQPPFLSTGNQEDTRDDTASMHQREQLFENATAVLKYLSLPRSAKRPGNGADSATMPSASICDQPFSWLEHRRSNPIMQPEIEAANPMWAADEFNLFMSEQAKCIGPGTDSNGSVLYTPDHGLRSASTKRRLNQQRDEIDILDERHTYSKRLAVGFSSPVKSVPKQLLTAFG